MQKVGDDEQTFGLPLGNYTLSLLDYADGTALK